jgi:ACR3 family arsenite efflux pump ArsB
MKHKHWVTLFIACLVIGVWGPVWFKLLPDHISKLNKEDLRIPLAITLIATGLVSLIKTDWVDG